MKIRILAEKPGMANVNLMYVAQLAYALTFMSYVARNMTWLRVGAISGSFVAIYYAIAVEGTPLWIPIFWNSLFIMVNGVHLTLSRWRARSVKLNALENFLAQTSLANFPPAEVRSFTALSSEGGLTAGAMMIQANTKIQHLFCILKGKVGIWTDGEKVADLGPGRFIGEMSLLTRAPTRADVIVESDLTVLVWPHESIESWVNSDASRLGHLQTALGTQIVETLLVRKNQRAG